MLRILKTYGILFLPFWGGIAVSAQSVISNSSLENYTYCPTSFAQFNANVLQWWNPVSHTGSGDYFNQCSSSIYADTPTNYWGTQTPHSGVAYVGFATYYSAAGSEFREYLETQTTSTLTAGTTYQLEFYISLCDQCGWGTDKLGALLSSTAITGSGTWAALPYTPTVIWPGAPITDKTNWTLFSGTFVAAGTERYLTIGNFSSDATTTLAAAGAGSIPGLAYYFIDDITLAPSAVLNAEMADFRAYESGNAISVNWSTLREEGARDFELERSTGDFNHFEKIGVIAAYGTSTQKKDYQFIDANVVPGNNYFYRLRNTDIDGKEGYSQMVEARVTGVNEAVSAVFPQPSAAGQPINIQLSLPDGGTVSWEIFGITGQLVASGTIQVSAGQTEAVIHCEALVTGTYMLKIVSPRGSTSRRISIE